MAEEQSPWINYIEQHLPEYQKVIKEHVNYVPPKKAPEPSQAERDGTLLMDNLKIDITQTPEIVNEPDVLVE